MKKIWLIIKREYWTRVRKKSFLIMTFLTPLLIFLFIGIVSLIMSYQSDKESHVLIVDRQNILDKTMKDGKNLFFTFSQDDAATAKKNLDPNKYDGLLVIDSMRDARQKAFNLSYYSDVQLSLETKYDIEHVLSERIREYKMTALQVNKEVLDHLETDVSLQTVSITEKGKSVSSIRSAVGAGLGGFMGFVMYMVVAIYGQMVMRSVMEEKMNRVVEVMISSVKPFQLMLGKLIGVGGVGLTQIAIWAITIPILSFLAQLLFGFHMPDPAAAGTAAQMVPQEDMQMMVGQVMQELGNINWWFILPTFIVFFICGYFMYGSMFAAIGSAISDDMGESQSLSIPITIPLVIAFYIMFVTVKAPDSSLAVWSSMFPLFSPIVMPARLAFDIPVWQTILSMLISIAATLGMIWISARIYRVGILMYGKKTSFKELTKWIFYKD